ncbi:MAG: hypothetical protein AAGI07_17245 [Bacteroidota bacterium]
MNISINLNRQLIAFAIPFSLFATLIYLIRTTLFIGNNTLTFTITADLLLTIPIIYFLLIRKTSVPNITVVTVLVLGLAIGTYFLPKESQTYLSLFKTWGLPLVELSVFLFIVLKVRYRIKKYQSLKGHSPDFFTTVKNTCNDVLPKKLVALFATELAVFYYGFINWKTYKLASNEFSYHKNSGTPTLFGAIIFLIAIETFVMHILLVRLNPQIAWGLSVLSSYTAIQIWGIARSLSKRPISISSNQLNLRYGILNEVTISLEEIKEIEITARSIENTKTTKKLSQLGDLESHNIIIHLNKEQTLIGFYGIKKKFLNIALYIDNKIEFKQQLKTAIQQSK